MLCSESITRSNELGMPIWLSTSRFAPSPDMLRTRQSIPEPSNKIVPAFRMGWRWVPRFSSRPGMLPSRWTIFLRAAFAQSRRLATSFSFRVLFQRQFADKLHDAIFDDIGFNADPQYLRIQANTCGAADRLDRRSLHGRASIVDRSSLSLMPKKRGPFHLVPVIAKATLDRLSLVWPFQAKPSAMTITRCDRRSHSRTRTVPGVSSVRFWSKLASRADIAGPSFFATV